MAILLGEFTAPESVCMYLPTRLASNQYRTMLAVSPEEFQEMLARGWRRFGPIYFRPACAGCRECVPIRVPVRTFQPTKSQRRAQQKCSDLRLEIRTPQVNEERLRLYHRWHAMREAERGWPESPISKEEYQMEFCLPHPCAREFAYYDRTRLVGIGYVDQTPEALSSMYFFYDPEYKERSIGIASVLREIETARELGLKYLYLGFRVLGCPSMEYKTQFRPHELLVGRPGDKEKPVWVAEEKFKIG
jgi:arginyl-tRNA--protein-N-Asp/Glu arginylyltransferase